MGKPAKRKRGKAPHLRGRQPIWKTVKRFEVPHSDRRRAPAPSMP